MAMRAVPLVGGPVELRGVLDLETTQAGVMPRRLPAWTREQYQDPSVYGVTVMPSGVRLVFRTDAHALEVEVLTSTGRLDSDPRPRPTGMLELLVDGVLAGRQQAPVGNVLRMAGPGAAQRLIPGEPATVRFAGLPAGMKDVELWLPQQTPTELVALRADGEVLAPLGIAHTPGEGGPGPDIGPLKDLGIAWAALRQDGTDYFDLHHTPDDTFDKIDPAALAQNVAAYAVFAYLAADAGTTWGSAPKALPAK